MEHMVDPQARRNAAQAVLDFRDCRISNCDFEAKWPRYDKRDRGLLAIETMLWRFYDDLREHKLDEPFALTQEGRDMFDRCALFLETGIEYQWPKDDFIAYGPGTEIVTLGLPDAAGRELIDLHVIGDDACWPFATRAEFEFYRQRLVGAQPQSRRDGIAPAG
jgi:hypothetical protein